MKNIRTIENKQKNKLIMLYKLYYNFEEKHLLLKDVDLTVVDPWQTIIKNFSVSNFISQ